MFKIDLRKKLLLALIFFVILSIMNCFNFFAHDRFVQFIHFTYVGLTNVEADLMDKNFAIVAKQILDGNKTYYIWAQWVGKNLFQFFIIFSIILGTIDFLMARNRNKLYYYLNGMTRKEYFFSRTSVSLFYIALTLILSYFVTTIFSILFSYNLNLADLALAHLQTLSSSLVFYTLLVNISMLINKKVWGYWAMTATIILFFVITLNIPEFMGFFSAKDIMLSSAFHPQTVIIPLLLSALLYFSAYRLFKRVEI